MTDKEIGGIVARWVELIAPGIPIVSYGNAAIPDENHISIDKDPRKLPIGESSESKPVGIGKIVFDSDFVQDNNIDITINEIIITTVPFNINQIKTITELKLQIEADFVGSMAMIDGRTISIQSPGGVDSVSASVTLGTSQPVSTARVDYVVTHIKEWEYTYDMLEYDTSDSLNLLINSAEHQKSLRYFTDESLSNNMITMSIRRYGNITPVPQFMDEEKRSKFLLEIVLAVIHSTTEVVDTIKEVQDTILNGGY